MKSRAAVMWGLGQKWEVEELEVDGPKRGELTIKLVAAGLCHSDEHIREGDSVPRFPIVGGHEGAGVVVQVGPGVEGIVAGDHVVCTYVPVCGTCRFCRMGRSNLCDSGLYAMDGCLQDGTFRFHGRDQDVGGFCCLGTFSEYITVSQNSIVKVDKDIPLELLATIGCAVPTGWGSSVYSGGVTEGDTTVVVGVGGIGVNALQGARYANARNIIAVDPVPFKQDQASVFGATHAVSTTSEAHELVMDLTSGVGADQAIISTSLMSSPLVSAGLEIIRKGGTLVLVGIAKAEALTIEIPGTHLTLFEKRIQGALCGSCNPHQDIPRLIDLYRQGDLKLAEAITRYYSLDELNQACDDLISGSNIRGAITFG